MKKILRFYLINAVSLWATTQILPGLTYNGGLKSLLVGGLAFSLINVALVPFLKILFLPLNILTLGIFAWLVNVLALYALTTVISDFRLLPFNFPGFSYNGINIPLYYLSPFWVAVLASFLIGMITHFLQWLTER